MNRNQLMLILFGLALFHVLCLLNKTYFLQKPGWPVILENGSLDQYLSLINNNSERHLMIQNTTIKYFGALPLWIDYIIYISGLLILSRLFLLFKKPDYSTDNKRGPKANL